MKHLNITLTMLLLFAISTNLNAQAVSEANNKRIEAEKKLNDGELEEAKNLVNEAITIFENNNINIPSSFSELKSRIDKAIADKNAQLQRQKRAADEEKRKEQFQYYERRFNSALEDNDVYEAQRILDEASQFGTNAEIERLRSKIADKEDEIKVGRLKSEYRDFERNRDYRKALEVYEQIEAISANDVSSTTMRNLKEKVKSYDLAMRKARSFYNQKKYSDSRSAIENAETYMRLEIEDSELLIRSKYYEKMTLGEEYAKGKSYDQALKNYKKAGDFAFDLESETRAKEAVKRTNKEKYLAIAEQEYQRHNYDNALIAIDKAEAYGGLTNTEKQFENRIKQAIEAEVWESTKIQATTSAYERYIRIYPYSTKNVSYAKQWLANKYEELGDDQLTNHYYTNASNYYTSALKYAPYSTRINKKLRRVKRWSAIGDDFYTLDLGIPIGLSQSTVTFNDEYSFLYELSPGLPTIEQDTGVNKVNGIRFMVPIKTSFAYHNTIRIPYVRPIGLTIRFLASTYTMTNINEFEPVSYEIYTSTYVPNGSSVTNVDTLIDHTKNQTRLSSIGLVLEVHPSNFLTLYMPIQRARLRFQSANSCLDCNEDEVDIGRTNLALGIRGNIPMNSVNISGYIENWNTFFNSDELTHDAFENPDLSAGLISFNPLFKNNIDLIREFN
jgi:tetratricopeptide (TPR) repeat protein